MDQRTQEQIRTKKFLKAAEEGDAATISRLLTKGVDANARDIVGWTALINAAIKNHTEVVHRLIKAGADVDLADEEGWTALLWATYHGQVGWGQGLLWATYQGQVG